MEREDLFQVRQEFIQTLEAKVMKGRKVHPFDKRALVEIAEEEIEGYKRGLVDKLSSYKQLASLVGVTEARAYRYLYGLELEDRAFRTKILRLHRSKENYKRNLVNLSDEQRRQRSLKAASTTTAEQRIALGVATREARRKKDEVIITEVVYRLLLRGVPPKRIAEKTDFTQQQVWHAIEHMTDSPNYKNIDQIKLLTEQIDYQSPQDLDGRNCTILMRELLKARLVVAKDIYWKRLNELGKIDGIKLPGSFEDRVCLESFLVTKKYDEKGEKEYLARFIKLGIQVDPEWFKEKLASYKNFLQEAYLLAR